MAMEKMAIQPVTCKYCEFWHKGSFIPKTHLLDEYKLYDFGRCSNKDRIEEVFNEEKKEGKKKGKIVYQVNFEMIEYGSCKYFQDRALNEHNINIKFIRDRWNIIIKYSSFTRDVIIKMFQAGTFSDQEITSTCAILCDNFNLGVI